MRKFLKVFVLVVLSTAMLAVMYGCIQHTDPTTGIKTWVLDPNVVGTVDTAANAAEQVAPTLIALSVLWPPLAAVGGIILGVVGMWKKLKPQVAKEQSKAEIAYTATSVLVNVIEDLKSNKELWALLKPKLQERFGELGTSIENVIRAIRGLPPKPE